MADEIGPSRAVAEPGADEARKSGRPSRIHFRTVNGSLYELDYDIGIWRRLERTKESGELRFQGGELLAHHPLHLGQSAFIVYIPFDAGIADEADGVSVLMTSPVVSIQPCWRSSADHN